MKRDWIRTESREVRPFPRTDHCLDGVRLRLSPDDEFSSQQHFEISEPGEIRPEFNLRIDLSPFQDDNGLPVGIADLCLVIRISDIRLKRSEIIFEKNLLHVPETWVIPGRFRDKFAWQHGVKLTVAIVLQKNRKVSFHGEPFLRGHWVARKDFSIRPKPSPRRFPIEQWTPDDFEQHGLPRDTAYWIQLIADDLNQQFDDPTDAFRICLRKDIFDILAAHQEKETTRALMSLILTEILAEVIFRGLSHMQDSDELERGGLLETALYKIRRATGATFQQLRGYVRDKDFASVRAFVQAALGTGRNLKRIAKE